MRIVIALLTVISLGTPGQANHSLATYQLRQVAGEWVLAANLSQSVIQTVLQKKYGEEVVARWSEDQYEQQLTRYLKENMHLAVDDTDLLMGDAMVRLGSYYTRVTFAVDGFLRDARQLDVRLTGMIENEGQENVFQLRVEDKYASFILKPENNYSATALIRPPAAGQKKEGRLSTQYGIFGIMGLIPIVTLLLLFFRVQLPAALRR